ncbi:hypothetical protein FOVSG1_002762 [Fusarium oxysporum f. sp. vasinfectum]
MTVKGVYKITNMQDDDQKQIQPTRGRLAHSTQPHSRTLSAAARIVKGVSVTADFYWNLLFIGYSICGVSQIQDVLLTERKRRPAGLPGRTQLPPVRIIRNDRDAKSSRS